MYPADQEADLDVGGSHAAWPTAWGCLACLGLVPLFKGHDLQGLSESPDGPRLYRRALPVWGGKIDLAYLGGAK